MGEKGGQDAVVPKNLFFAPQKNPLATPLSPNVAGYLPIPAG